MPKTSQIPIWKLPTLQKTYHWSIGQDSNKIVILIFNHFKVLLIYFFWPAGLDWLQTLKQFFISAISYTCSLSYFDGRAIRVRLATSIWYDLKQSHQSKTSILTRLATSIWYDTLMKFFLRTGASLQQVGQNCHWLLFVIRNITKFQAEIIVWLTVVHSAKTNAGTLTLVRYHIHCPSDRGRIPCVEVGFVRQVRLMGCCLPVPACLQWHHSQHQNWNQI